MSEMETHIGTLEKIPIEHGMTVEEKAEEICKNRFGIRNWRRITMIG